MRNITILKKATLDKPILYRPYIDGLRTIAIVMVILFHIWSKSLNGGFIGVDIFFVISGFLITSIINKELQTSQFSFAHFYARRIRRILPVFFVVVYISSVAAYLMLLPEDYIKFVNSTINAALYYSNMYFLNQDNYFTLGAQEFPLLHTWSLSVEEQYYIFWPLVLFGLSKITHKSKWFAPAVITSLFIISYGFSIYCAFNNVSLGYYAIFSRAFELMVGSILALLIASDNSFIRRAFSHKLRFWLSFFSSVTGLAMVIVAACFF